MSRREPDDELLALFALDALEGSERDAVEQAVSSSPKLAARLEQHRSAAAALAYDAAAAPPPDLKRRVLAAAFAELPPRAVAAAEAPSVVVPLDAARRRSRTITAVIGGLAAAAAVFAGVLIMTRDEPAPTARAVLVGAAGQLDAELVDERLTLTGRDIPDVAGSQTYQLWLIGVDEQPRSAGIFIPRPDGSVDRAFSVGADAGGVTTLAITVEPAGGSVGPTSEPQFVGQFD